MTRTAVLAGASGAVGSEVGLFCAADVFCCLGTTASQAGVVKLAGLAAEAQQPGAHIHYSHT